MSQNASDISQPIDPRVVTCPCGKTLRLSPEQVGKTIRCPDCQHLITAPRGPVSSHTKTIQSPPSVEGPSLVGFLAPRQTADELGRLGGYRVLKVLGHGGMGVVYKAEDPRLARFVALKVMLPGVARAAHMKERFLREARAAAAIRHDHVVSIFQTGEERGVPFVAMEYLEGESLDSRLKRERRLPIGDVVRIGREVALGLAAAHARGLIHRDIKPANIWLDSGTGRAKILDFGLARIADGAALKGTVDEGVFAEGAANAAPDAVQLTQTGMIVGTPAYMAPEQAAGKTVDHRCDLYSLGVILYLASTAERPIKGDNPITLLSNLAVEIPRAPRLLNSAVPAALNDLILRLLAKRPDDRPASATVVADQLRSLDRDPSPASPAKAVVPRTPSSSRALVGVVALGVLVVLGSVLGGWALLSKHGPQPQPGENGAPPDVQLSAFDGLDRKNIPPLELKLAGKGDAANAPPELVAVIGDSRFRHPKFMGHFGGLAVSPDGSLVAAMAGEMAVRIWNSETGELVRFLPHSSWPRKLVFAPDGTLLVAQWEGGVLAWNLRTGGKRHAAFQHPGARQLALSGDGTLALTSHPSGEHRVWNAETGKLVIAVNGDRANSKLEQAAFAALSADGTRLAFVKDNLLRLWNIPGDKDDGVIADLEPGAVPVAFSPDGKHLVAAHGNFEDLLVTRLTVCDMTRLKAGPRLVREAHINDISISPDSKSLLTAGAGKTVEIWNLETGEMQTPLPVEAGWCAQAAYFPNSPRFATLDDMHCVSVRNLRGEPLLRMGRQPLITGLRFGGDSIFAHGQTDGQRVGRWRDPLAKRETLPVNWMGANMEVSRDGRKLAFAGGGSQLSILDPETGVIKTLEATHPAHGNVNSVGLSRDGRRAAMAGPLAGDNVTTVWDLASGEARVYKNTGTFVFLPDDGKLVHLAPGGLVAATDLASGDTLWTRDVFALVDLRASADGKFVAAAQWYATTEPTLVFDGVTGAKLYELPPSIRVAFSPDGRKLATLSPTALGVWNTKTGERERHIPLGLDQTQVDIDFAAEGRHVIVAGGTGVVSIYRVGD